MKNVALVWSQCSECRELRVVRKWLVIRCRRMSLRNRENVQGESATKGYVEDINLSDALKQSGRNANVRKQEEEVAISVVLVIVGQSDVTAGPHGTAVAGLKRKKAVCVPGGTVLASISTVQTKQTECDGSHQESRNGCHKLLFGDVTVEDTLDGGPSVSDSYWWVVSISQ